MTSQFKVVQCPHCSEYTYLAVTKPRPGCAYCGVPVNIHTLEGEVVSTLAEAQRLIQTRQSTLQGLSPTNVLGSQRRRETAVLRLLRKKRGEEPHWLPLSAVISLCADLGLSPEEACLAISSLVDHGFVELRERGIRYDPLC